MALLTSSVSAFPCCRGGDETVYWHKVVSRYAIVLVLM